MERIVAIIDHMPLLKTMSKFKRDETAKRIKAVEKKLNELRVNGSLGGIK